MEYKPQHPLEPGAHSAPNEARRKHELERGQAIVLIAFVMVGLIAMLGLSVDGGGILFLYRDARNATDAATLAAAYALCAKGSVDDGYVTAEKNGFDDNEVDNDVKIEWPPESGIGINDSDYVTVRIKAFKPSYFIQIVYPEPLWISAEATGFCRKPFQSSRLGAIFGLSKDCQQQGVVEVSGSDIYVQGDIFSNEDTKLSGSQGGIRIDGSLGTVTTFEPANFEDKVYVNGSKQAGAEDQGNPLDWVDIDDYRPGGIIYDALEAKNPDQVYYITSTHPDYKNGTWNPGNGAEVSGFYMVEGAVDLSHIRVNPDIGLTVVATGKINLNNPEKNSNIKFYAPLLTLNDDDIPSVGFLFYSEDEGVSPNSSCGSNEDVINFTASEVNVSGVLYAPRGNISGSYSSGTYIGALLGWRVSLSGSASEIIRDPDMFPPQPPRVSIAQ